MRMEGEYNFYTIPKGNNFSLVIPESQYILIDLNCAGFKVPPDLDGG